MRRSECLRSAGHPPRRARCPDPKVQPAIPPRSSPAGRRHVRLPGLHCAGTPDARASARARHRPWSAAARPAPGTLRTPPATASARPSHPARAGAHWHRRNPR
ncbi:hypothetical protein G6F58_013330 [Rhizopus delemar]|nr:hypothetical protein G6F58_013330 [Rhizopus delemar]